MSTGMRLSAHSMRRRPASASLESAILKLDMRCGRYFPIPEESRRSTRFDRLGNSSPRRNVRCKESDPVTSQLWQEWMGQWPLPGVAVALVGVFLALRVALPVAERGRIRAGILF